MNWFELALKLFQLAPQLVALIGAVETAIGAGNGPAKKALVMLPLASAPPELKAVASTFVDNVVTEKNKAIPPVPVATAT